MITTIAAILAVDVTIDGQIDTIPALIQAVSSTATISAGGAADRCNCFYGSRRCYCRPDI